MATKHNELNIAVIDDATRFLSADDVNSTLPSNLQSNKIFYQSTAPTNPADDISTGDLWVDTDDNQQYRWDGSSWLSVQDTNIQTALGRATIFRQASTPTANNTGDIWYDSSDNNAAYYWNGSSWENTTYVSAGGTNTYIQESAPAGANVGDIWFDSNNNNKMQFYNGSAWTDYEVNTASNAINLNGTAGSTVVTNAANGATFTSSSVYTGTLTASQVNVSGISASNITTGTMSAARISGGTMSAVTLSASFFDGNLTATSGYITSEDHNSITIPAISGRNLYAGATASAVGVRGRADWRGVQGIATNSSGHGGNFQNSSESKYADLGGPTYGAYVIGGHYPFTGCHDALIEKSKKNSFTLGDIAVDLELISSSGVDDAICNTEISSLPKQKNVIGIFNSVADKIVYDRMECFVESIEIVDEDDERDGKVKKEKRKYKDLSRIKNKYLRVGLNSLGEGLVNVCGENGDLEAGDLITTSSMPGKGMKQDDDIIRNYTVAKCRENVTFSSPDEVKMVACIYLCG